MDDAKRTAGEIEEKSKEAWRKRDGEDLADKVGNAGDDLRKNLGNLGDDLNRELHHPIDDSARPTSNTERPR